jgi:Flp pilus assembly protein CpaB
MREAGTSQPAGRRMRRRLSASHILVALTVVLAFVLNILALQDRSASILVAVADRPISAGSVLSVDMVRLVSISTGFEGLDTLVTQGDIPAYSGWVVQRAIPAGGVLDRASLAEPGAPSGRRSMSLPIPMARAAGGTIVAGDRVDVITVSDGTARYVVAGVDVVSVPSAGSGAFGAPDYHLVVAVDADQALALAGAMELGGIDVVRSTGAPPVVVGLAGDGP